MFPSMFGTDAALFDTNALADIMPVPSATGSFLDNPIQAAVSGAASLGRTAVGTVTGTSGWGGKSAAVAELDSRNDQINEMKRYLADYVEDSNKMILLMAASRQAAAAQEAPRQAVASTSSAVSDLAELGAGKCMAGGTCVASGQSKACMQTDGNFVWYEAGAPRWASNTATADVGVTHSLCMQSDGNLVMYRNSGTGTQVPFASDTRTGSVLRVGSSGAYVLDAGGAVVWPPATPTRTAAPAAAPPPPAPPAPPVYNPPKYIEHLRRNYGGKPYMPKHNLSDDRKGDDLVRICKEKCNTSLGCTSFLVKNTDKDNYCLLYNTPPDEKLLKKSGGEFSTYFRVP